MASKKITMRTKDGKTFEEGFECFITEHCIIPNLRASTINHYREMVKYSFYKFYDKENLLENLEQSIIEEYTFYLRESKIRESTVNIHLKALKTIINFFREKDWIDYSINVKLIKADIEEIEAYTDDEIKKLLVKPNLKTSSWVEYRNWTLVNFLCNTGARRMTIVNIQVEDLDLENGFVFYRHTKNRKKQTVPVTPTMVNVLREYLEYLPEGTVYLFPTVLGGQLKVRTLTHTLEDYNRNKGVARTGVHKFRHWFAKRSVLLGMDLMRLQKILGHSNLDILRNYVNLLTQDLKYNEIQLNPLEDFNTKNAEKKYINLKGRMRK